VLPVAYGQRPRFSFAQHFDAACDAMVLWHFGTGKPVARNVSAWSQRPLVRASNYWAGVFDGIDELGHNSRRTDNIRISHCGEFE